MEGALAIRENAPAAIGGIENAEARFLQFLDAAPKTVQTYARALRQFTRWRAERGITYPTREDILLYRDELKATHKASTVQNYIVALRLLFQWLEQERIYPNVAAHIKGAKVSKTHKKDYLTSAQVKDILQTIDRATPAGRRDYAIFLLMFSGGLRDIEVNRARIEDLRALGEGTVLYLQGKGRSDKTDYVKILPPVEKAIRASLADRPGAKDSDPLFMSTSRNSYGKPLSTRTISGIIKRCMVNAGYSSDRLTAHSLRHTAVTLALLGGGTLQEVQQFARHTNIATTQIYAHNLERAANPCEDILMKSIS